MSAFICVQCGESVDSLYVEYSETNIRLTRCQKCGKVADKYVEYELLLVFLDAVLHRKPAMRHLLYNRMNDSAFQRAMRWVPATSIGASCLLKVMTLHGSYYHTINLWIILHVVACALIEQLIIVSIAALTLYCTPSAMTALLKQNKCYIKTYLVLVSPELIRMFAVMLQIFDTEATLLSLFGVLILSIQFLAFQCLTNIRTAKIVVCATAVLVCRVAVNYLVFYSRSDLLLLGVIM